MQLEPEQKKRLTWIACGLAAVVLIVLAVVFSLESGVETAPTGTTYSGAAIPDNELLVEDRYDGETLIPKFELSKSRYDAKKFVEKDGFLRYNDSNARLGIDVSEHQGKVDWKTVKEAGMDFAILRLGYRGTTQGLLYMDEAFEENFQNALDAGLFVGVYFFSQATSEEEAEEEAQFVLDALGGRKTAYPVVFDWEIPSAAGGISAEDMRVNRVTGAQAAKYGAAFCKKIKEAGYTPAVYTNKYCAYQFFDMSLWKGFDLWYAEYQKVPSLYYDFRIWQYTEEGKVPGVEGAVDIDICFKPY